MRAIVLFAAAFATMSATACHHHDRDTHEPSSHASVETPRHPAYLQALSNLKSARAHLERKSSDSKVVNDDANAAVVAIDRAISTVKEAAANDGKDLAQTPSVDRDPDTRDGQLHKALDDLKAAKRNVDMDETNAETRDLRRRALAQINTAIKHTDDSISAVNRGS